MPASFYEENCRGYHRVLQGLDIERIGDETTELDNGVATMHLPGHSPDSLAVMLNDEALIVGDVVLPDITPWPTRLEQYEEVSGILAPLYPHAGSLFGLKRYLASLHKLLNIAEQFPDIAVFPAHRLYYREQWNLIRLEERLRMAEILPDDLKPRINEISTPDLIWSS